MKPYHEHPEFRYCTEYTRIVGPFKSFWSKKGDCPADCPERITDENPKDCPPCKRFMTEGDKKRWVDADGAFKKAMEDPQ